MSLRRWIPLLRLRFVFVPLVPQYLGIVLASRELWPTQAPGLPGRWILAALAFMVSGFSTYLLNDVCDLGDDAHNPRRRTSPLVQGNVRRGEALAWAAGLRLAALLTAAGASWGCLGAMAAASLLSIAYSVPPLRLKARAGWDIFVQAGAVGCLYPLSGWALLRPVSEFPWLLGAHAGVYQAGPLLLTMLYDLPSDRSRGIGTTAVRLGARGSFRLCLALMLAGMALLAILAAGRSVITPRFLVYALPVAILHWAVMAGAWRRRDDPVALRRYVYLTGAAALLPYILWALYLGGVLPA